MKYSSIIYYYVIYQSNSWYNIYLGIIADSNFDDSEPPVDNDWTSNTTAKRLSMNMTIIVAKCRTTMISPSSSSSKKPIDLFSASAYISLLIFIFPSSLSIL